MRGGIAVLSRNGSMLIEACSLLSVNAICQSIGINIGGDLIGGPAFFNLRPLLEDDAEAKAIVLFCELGRFGEQETGRLVRETSYSKTIVAFIGGSFVGTIPDVRFGHAAVVVHGQTRAIRTQVVSVQLGQNNPNPLPYCYYFSSLENLTRQL